jgi:cytidylate kinase
MKSIPQIAEEQINRWQVLNREVPEEIKRIPVVTISREPGSGGRIVAQKLAERLRFEVFHQEVLHEMAKEAKISEQMLAALDERGLSILEDWISSLVNSRHLWPDKYLHHLMHVIGTIGKLGQAVVVGRGANFILPAERRFRVRIIASRKLRIQNVAREFGMTEQEAKRRVIKTESNRQAFIRKYFNADIADPTNYDLVINTDTLSLPHAVDVIAAAMGCLVECDL